MYTFLLKSTSTNATLVASGGGGIYTLSLAKATGQAHRRFPGEPTVSCGCSIHGGSQVTGRA